MLFEEINRTVNGAACMNPLQIININSLMAATSGRAEVIIGIIDGPVAVSHPDLPMARFFTISSATAAACKVLDSQACLHGTFVTGMLYGKRESQSPGLCPGCSATLRPVFCESTSSGQSCPEVTPHELASAIIETVNAGAWVINLSLGLTRPVMLDHQILREAFDYAFHKGTLLIAASGNHGQIGPVPLFAHTWVIPVAACDSMGRLASVSNIGPSVGKRGLMAPGVDIVSTSATGGYTQMSGTSVAVPFVTGTAALLWSLFPKATAADIRSSLLLPGVPRKSVVPPLLNAGESLRVLQERYETGSD